MHDIFGVGLFLMVFSAIVFFAPELGGYFLEYNNFIPADPLKTPPHIAPVWYFTPFYSMLRATTEMVNDAVVIIVLGAVVTLPEGRVNRQGGRAGGGCRGWSCAMWTFDAKFWGVVVMGGAVIILFFLPWLDNSPVKSIRYRPSWQLWFHAVFVGSSCPGLSGHPAADRQPAPLIAQVGTLFYFGFFLLMPWWSTIGTPKAVPDRVTFHAH